MTARRGHQGRRARLHGRGPPLTSPRRGGRRRRRPSGRPEQPARAAERAKGAARRAPGAGRDRAAGGGRRAQAGQGSGALAPGSPGLSPCSRARAAPSQRGAGCRRRACADAEAPPESRRTTPARGKALSRPPLFFFSPAPSRGPGQIIGERKLGSCQSLGGWVGLEAERGWVV